VTTHIKIIAPLLEEIHADLSRPHTFAAERVGFLTCGVAHTADDTLVLLGSRWHPIDDVDYIRDASVGAAIGPAAFRMILKFAYHHPVSVFHVHRHDHRGLPEFSSTDTRSAQKYVPGFFNVQRSLPHGAIVLSIDQAAGNVWLPGRTASARIDRFKIVGAPLRSWP
jgi:hypothetical protein